jgi:hypothetical protein
MAPIPASTMMANVVVTHGPQLISAQKKGCSIKDLIFVHNS